MVLEQLDIHMLKKINPDKTVHSTEINTKWIIDLNMKCKTIKAVKDKIGENPDDLSMAVTF